MILLVFMPRPFVRKPASGDSRGSCVASRRANAQMCHVKDTLVMGKWKSTFFGSPVVQTGGEEADLFITISVQKRESRGVGAVAVDTCTRVRHRLGWGPICADVFLTVS